ncbi:MAG: DUF6446 family protein [Pseudomonadota bacterium]
MTGRTLLIGGALLLSVFTGVLWYTQFYAYYGAYPQPEDGLLLDQYPIASWEGIDGSSSPLKVRVCASVSAETATQILVELEAQEPGDPLVPPPWFECFDAKQISRDLTDGMAKFFLLGPSDFDGVDDVMAVYADGRIYLWRQLDERFAN